MVLTLAAVSAVPRPDNRQQLQQLARLPTVQLAPALRYHPAAGFIPFPDLPAARRTADEIRFKFQKKPGAARAYLHIGNLLAGAGSHTEALLHWTSARELLRTDLAASTQNPELLAALAEALLLTDRFGEAEHYLRQAEALQPGKRLLVRARFHQMRAWHKIVPASENRRPFEDALRVWVREKPSPLAVSELQLELAALRSALETTPASLDERRGHAELHFFLHHLDRAIRSLQGQIETRPVVFPQKVLSLLAEVTADPESLPEDAASAALLTVVRAGYQLGTPTASIIGGTTFNTLPPSASEQVAAALNRLERLGEPGLQYSTAALELRGCFQFLIAGDISGAEKSLRAAIAAGTPSDRAWDYLTLLLMRSERLAEAVDLAEQRALKSKNIRHQVLLAKAYERSGDLDLAQLTLLLALQSNRYDFLANLALAGVLLKSPQLDENRPRILDALTKAERNLGAHPPLEHLRDLALTRVIFYGITEEYDEARRILKQWENQEAGPEFGAALEIIGY